MKAGSVTVSYGVTGGGSAAERCEGTRAREPLDAVEHRALIEGDGPVSRRLDPEADTVLARRRPLDHLRR
jgi:hypothetical protein